MRKGMPKIAEAYLESNVCIQECRTTTLVVAMVADVHLDVILNHIVSQQELTQRTNEV
jgi:hypothetical protein